MNTRIILLVNFSLFLFAGTVYAHRVNLFAWQEGDTVKAQAYWANGQKVSGAVLQISDESGTVLFRRRTDEDGICMFKVPGPGKFRIVLDAGMGHRAETEIDCSVSGAKHESPTGFSDKAHGSVPAAVPEAYHDDMPPRRIESCQAALQGSMKEMESILDRKFVPVMTQLTAIREQQDRIKPQDVIGGLGYIIGLAGLALWASARKNHTRKNHTR